MLESPLVCYIPSIHHSFHSLKVSSSCPGISAGDWSKEVESLYLTELSSECISAAEAFGPQIALTAALGEKTKTKRSLMNLFLFSFLYIKVNP